MTPNHSIQGADGACGGTVSDPERLRMGKGSGTPDAKRRKGADERKGYPRTL